MAEADQETVQVPPSLSDEEDDESRLQTIELNPEEQKPVLSFQQDNEDPIVSTPTVIPSIVNNTPMQPAATNPIESSVFPDGTQLEGRTPVTKTIITTSTTLKDWGFQQYKVTKQVLSERFGKGFKTVDTSLETRLEGIKDTQKKYQQLMALSGQLQFHLLKMVETQKAIAEHFAFLSVRCPELNTEFEFNSETQKRISRNGETLVASLKFFISNVHTVSAKSIEDTLVTGKQYEMARILYDAYRTDLETMTKAAKTSQAAANKLPSVQAEYDQQKEIYEKIRYDMDIKIKLLDENRFKVMQRQLVLLHSAFAAYFSGNHTVMESIVKEFHDKLESKRTQRTDPPTWLENLDDSAP